MPLRSVLEIEVDDAAFRNFQSLFEKYQAALDRLPSAWGKVNEKTGAVKSDFADMAAAMMAQHELLAKTSAETESLARSTGTAGRFFSGMARDAQSLATHIGNATRDLVRWSGLTTLAGGLLGLGSIFGLERLGVGAGNLRRTATGLGFAPGDAGSLTSFNTNLSRLVDPGQFLGGVNTAMNDVSQRWTLYAAGLNEGQIRGRDTGQVSLALLQQAWRVIQQAPEGQLANVMQARGLDRFLSLQDANRLKSTPYSELQGFIAQTQEDRLKGFGVTDQQLKNWQNLNVQLERAGNTIWTTLVVKLGDLAGPIGGISKAMTDVVDSLLKGPGFAYLLGVTSGALEDFAKYVGTDKFKEDINNFGTGVSHLVTSLGDAVKAVNNFTGGVANVWDIITGGKFEREGAWNDKPIAPGSRPFSWWNPGTWLPSAHIPGTGPSWLDRSSSNFNVPAGSDFDMARDALKSSGMNATAIAGAMAAMNAESGLNASKVRPGGTDASWAQWVGSRRTKLESFGWTGKDPVADRAAAAKMLNWELTTNPSYLDMIKRMNAAPNATAAAKIFGFDFEQGRANAGLFGGGGFNQERLDAFHSKGAEDIYRKLISGTGPGGSRLPDLSAIYVFGKNPHAGSHWFTDPISHMASYQQNPVPPESGLGTSWNYSRRGGREATGAMMHATGAAPHVTIGIHNVTGGAAAVSAAVLGTP